MSHEQKQAAVPRTTTAGKGKKRPETASQPTPPGQRAFLGPEFGLDFDDDGEPVGLTLRQLFRDPELRQMGLRLWRQFQDYGVTDEKSLERAGMTLDELIKPGVSETLSTSSTPEEIRRYRMKLEYRADLLEALLDETLAELEGLAKMRPAQADAGEPGKAGEDTEPAAEGREPEHG